MRRFRKGPIRGPALLVGEWHSDIHEEPWAIALRTLGYAVRGIRWSERLRSSGHSSLRAFAKRVENRLIAGPSIAAINNDVLRAVGTVNPKFTVFYRPTHILPGTLEDLKTRGVLTVSFNNDDPFSRAADPLLWRHYLAGLPYYDVNLVYRQRNVDQVRRAGGRNVAVLRSSFIPWIHRPWKGRKDDLIPFTSDVVFAGHYEGDHRLEYLRAISLDSNIRLRIFGPDWDRAPRTDWIERFWPIRPATGADYVKAISAAQIALVFFSTLNGDSYTRRCFEIPAIGAFMLCQRTEEMESLFAPGKEAEYFSSPEEMIEKIRFYLANDAARTRISRNGTSKVWRAGHDVYSRMRQLLSHVARASSP